MKPILAHFHFFIFLVLIGAKINSTAPVGGGQWNLLQHSIGVSAMHMQLLYNDRVIIFDRTDFGPSNLSLSDGKCRNDSNDIVLKIDCTAHSAEYDVANNTFRPLMILTDSWCSSGMVASDGHLIQTGGWNDGDRAVRNFVPCNDSQCDWSEMPQGLAVPRWYATNQILPDSSAIIIGGRQQFNYEFYPKFNRSTLNLSFLRETKDDVENNLYPFVHLNVDGNLFIFANNRAILFDYTKNTVVRTYPVMPGGDPRNYPSSGSSVLLPLKPSATEAEVLVCGGAPMGSYANALLNKTFIQALKTCGRIKITGQSPSWFMETMPTPRVMGDMVLLPTGEVLLINGAAAGSAGWELGREPVLTPIIYRPESPAGDRFQVQNPATIPRMYHSSAILLRDGRVLVGGSNPHIYYNFTGVEFPTELSLETFSPEYLSSENSNSRPIIVNSASPISLTYGKQFNLAFTMGAINGDGVSVTMVAPAFSTHSFSMNQRLLILENGKALTCYKHSCEVAVMAPQSRILAPSGFYMVFVVNGGIPSEGVWAHIR